MKKTILFFSSVIMLASCCGQSEKAPKGIEHVIVIGLDGLSSQGLREANTPTMDNMMANGAYSFKVRCVLPTVSKPNWNAMLCGAGPDITGCTSNGWYRDKYDLVPVAMTDNQSFPNIFYVIRQQRPDAELGSIYHWDDFGSILDKEVLNLSETYNSALVTTEKTAEYIKDKKPDFLFIQLDDVDHYGHSDGHMSEAYLKSIQEADSQVKTILDAIREAGIEGSTMVMIVSDHGGILHGHGGNTYEELTTPIIYYGKGIKKGYEIRQQIYRFDVAADVAFALGVKAPQVWVGRPVKAAFEGFDEPENIWEMVEILPPPSFETKTFRGPLVDSAYKQPVEVRIKAPVGVKGEIRYTVDGSVPTRQSSRYNGAFTVDSTTIVTAKLFGDKGESIKVQGKYAVGK